MRGPSPASLYTLRAASLTLGAAALGGAAFHALGLPAAWISGALVCTVALAVAGVRVAVPERLRFAAYVILGSSMGTVLTPQMMARAAAWPVSMACLAAGVTFTMIGSTLFLTRVARWNLETAFYASTPGAFSAVIAMAEDTAADMRKVSFNQALRLFLLVAALPNLLGATGLAPTGLPPAPHLSPLPDVAVLLVLSLAGALLALRLKVPGGAVVGPLVASAALHLSNWSDALMPPALLLPAFVVLGAGVGARFLGTRLATIREFLGVCLGAFLVAVTISAAFALLAAVLTGDDFGKLLTAFAPGALEAMTALGFALGYDPAFMGAHHVFRFAGLSLLLPVVARLLFAAREGH